MGDIDTAIRFPAADTVSFETAGSERLRVDSSGRLLVAATSGTARVHIKGNGGDGIKIENSGGTNAACIDLKNTLSSYNKEYRIAVAGSDGAYATASSLFVRDQTAGATRLELASSGDLKVSTGDIFFGTAGKGICLGNTANVDANTLEDYEEGTFTPNYDAGGGVTFSYSQQYGFYTKIGDTVFFTIYLQGYASTITGGNENNGVALQGLPFTIKNHARYNPAFTIGRTYKWDIDSDKRMYSYGTPNTTTARFIIESDDSTGSIAVASQLNANTTEMFLNGHYKVSG